MSIIVCCICYNFSCFLLIGDTPSRITRRSSKTSSILSLSPSDNGSIEQHSQTLSASSNQQHNQSCSTSLSQGHGRELEQHSNEGTSCQVHSLENGLKKDSKMPRECLHTMKV